VRNPFSTWTTVLQCYDAEDLLDKADPLQRNRLHISAAIRVLLQHLFVPGDKGQKAVSCEPRQVKGLMRLRPSARDLVRSQNLLGHKARDHDPEAAQILAKEYSFGVVSLAFECSLVSRQVRM
jgi:hypothetical protein